MTESAVPSSAAAAVVVNTGTTTLFDTQGATVEVPAQSVDYFMKTYGFTRSRHDPEVKLREIWPLFDDARRLVGEYYQAVTQGGTIDAAERGPSNAAEFAMATLWSSWLDLHGALHQIYPVQQPADPAAQDVAAGEPPPMAAEPTPQQGAQTA